MTDYIPRLPDELDEEYIYRICSQKDLIGTWSDIANILNKEFGWDYSESKYRKQFQAFEKMFAANLSKFAQSDEYLQQLKDARIELEKERYKLNTTRTEYTRQLRQQSRFELFYENIKSAIETLPIPEFAAPASTSNKRVPCLTISDIHFGASFTSQNNTYSMDEASRRFASLLSQTKNFITNHGYSSIKVAVLGDCIQGMLRLSDLLVNESTIVEATVKVSRLIANFLNELSTICRIDYYHVPASNHTQLRPLGTKASELAAEDVEFIVGNYIKDLLADNQRVSVNLESKHSYIRIPIFDFHVIALHGHTIKNIESSLKDLSHLHRVFYDYVLMGHFHNGKELPVGESTHNDTEVLVSASFVGSDPYSDSIMKGCKGSCKLYVFDELHGHCETHKFYL